MHTRISDPPRTRVRPSGGDCFKSARKRAGEGLPPRSPGKYVLINTIFYVGALKQASSGILAFTKNNTALRASKGACRRAPTHLYCSPEPKISLLNPAHGKAGGPQPGRSHRVITVSRRAPWLCAPHRPPVSQRTDGA